MAYDEETKFRFDFGGIKLEVSGDREFVERIYRQVMEDVEEARRRNRAEELDSPRKLDGDEEDKEALWVHRCDDMMRKIYMVSRDDLTLKMLNRVVNPRALENIYVEKQAFEKLFPDLENGYTLWAEFTSTGRERIAKATKPVRKALQVPKSQS